MKAPKEKAEELFDKFNREGLHQISPVINRVVRKQMIKQCAGIALDEIIEAIHFDWMEEQNLERQRIYWNEVKHEIEVL